MRLLPSKVTFVIPTPSSQDLPGDDRQLLEDWPNRETVENIGQRIRQLRESRGMTQSQLQARSRVSRSYLSRIESGQMTPSLGTLEKIAEALGVGLNRFFVPESDGANATRGSVHPGIASISAPARLGAVAIHPQAFAGNQRPRQQQSRDAAARAADAAANAAIEAVATVVAAAWDSDGVCSSVRDTAEVYFQEGAGQDARRFRLFISLF